MNKKYEYNCIDKSVLTPFFRDYIAAPILKFIPISIHPNLITVISFLFSIGGLTIAFCFDSGLLTNLLVAGCIFLYLLLDHLDGMQAKRRGGGVPLGEWMDHFLDVLVNGLVMLTMIQLFDINNLIVQISIFSFGYVSQAMVFLEQRESSVLHFGKVESLEAVLILCLVITLSSIDIIERALMANMLYGFRLIDLTFMLSSMMGLKVIVESYLRIGKKIWPIFILLVSIILIIVFADYLIGEVNIIFLIAATAILINQEYLIGHLTGKKNLIVDFLPIIGFTMALLLNVNPILVIGFIGTVVLVRFILTVNTLRKYKKVDIE